ncbi:MAG: lamin tail domain-containing protein [Draconibacterium sp.]|nr:lamin tail domain-containing protein [Draconibacterium sp.]
MKPNLPKILTFLLILVNLQCFSQEIWRESFSIPNKGIWGDEDGKTIHTDFEDITTWTLEYANVSLSSPDDYAKTVTTSGGRFECRDINAEVIWRSETIDISEFKNISIQLYANETGSGANEENKYLKAFYILDEHEKIMFETNAINTGNWGKAIAKHSGIEGKNLQIVVYMNNHYASDKVILDEVVVMGEEKNPIVIEPGDLLINEVLFNPVPDGEDFVEIYNYSEKQIPLNKLYLASRNKNLELTQIYSLSDKRDKLEPKNYLALTKDTNGVFPWFHIKCYECFLQMNRFPSFNNDEDHVVLLNNQMEVIDEFFYNEKMHAPLLYDREGISLERISFSASTNDKRNWQSASTESGYGTPGYKNSQYENPELERISVTFEPEAFSPNNDGYNDIYTINFQLDKPGYICNIWIYDSAGKLIRKLADNNILGTNEQIKWNGENETGQRLKLGPYIILVEIFSSDGYVKQFKDGIILTDILE